MSARTTLEALVVFLERLSEDLNVTMPTRAAIRLGELLREARAVLAVRCDPNSD